MRALAKDLYNDIAQWPEGCRYSIEQRLAVLGTYASTGNMKKTAREIGIPEATIIYWRDKSPWWQAHITRIRAENNDLVDAKLSEIIHKANNEQLERIDSGDEIMGKDGDMVRRKISGRDLATIGAIAFDKRQILRNQPTSITQAGVGALDALAEKMLQKHDERMKTVISVDSSSTDSSLSDDRDPTDA